MSTSSMIDHPESAAWQLGVMTNIVREMPKTKRRSTPNWVLVQKFLTGHTSRGGRTSAFKHCEFLGVDPSGFSFELKVVT